MNNERPQKSLSSEENIEREQPTRTPEVHHDWPLITYEYSRLYLDLADKHLEKDDPLRARIVDYFSESERLEHELRTLFAGLDDDEIHQRMEDVAKQLFDRTFFVEHYQKIFERMDAHNGIKERTIERPMATQEEYDLGTYKEGLERQVRDACFLLSKKGYKTFESGFREKEDDRDQYLGVSNKTVEIPDEVIARLKEKQFEVSIIRQNDRTIINIHPEKTDAVTLEEWEEIWNELARGMPAAKSEDFSGVKIYELHRTFRERQDVLRRLHF